MAIFHTWSVCERSPVLSGGKKHFPQQPWQKNALVGSSVGGGEGEKTLGASKCLARTFWVAPNRKHSRTRVRPEAEAEAEGVAVGTVGIRSGPMPCRNPGRCFFASSLQVAKLSLVAKQSGSA